MYAFNANSGEIVWTFEVFEDGASQFHGNPLTVDSLIVFGTDEGSMETGALYCLNRITGKLQWKSLGHSGVASDPAFNGDSLVYVVTRDDSLLAVSLNSGTVAWSFFTGWQRTENYEYPRLVDIPKLVSSPVTLDEAVIIIGRDSTLYSFDGYTGRQLWSTPLHATNSSALLSVSGTLVIGLSDSTLTTIDVRAGEVVRKDTLDYFAFGGMVDSDRQLYFLVANDDLRPTEVAAFDRANRELQWTTSIRDYDVDVYWYVPRVHHWRHEIVIGSTKGRVVGCDEETGRWIWQTQLDGPIRGIGHSDSLLFVGTFDGILYALKIVADK